MATILSFKPGARHSGSAVRAGVGGPAEIVFFPGVRYERWSERAQAKAPKKRRATRRDKIVMND